MPAALWILAAFLAGSLPTAVGLGRLRGVDIRKHGSGNPGASNLGRTCGKKWGLICFLIDVAKGLAPVLAYTLAGGVAVQNLWLWEGVRIAVAVAAVMGHVLNPWLGFRGGKGVATGLGAVLGFWPVLTVAGLAAFALWVVVIKRSGYVGLASVVAAGAAVPLALASVLTFGAPLPSAVLLVALVAAMSAMIIARHRGNLARIRAGTEPKAGWAAGGGGGGGGGAAGSSRSAA